MLAEVLFASVDTKRNKAGRPQGLSVSQLYPCPYRLYLVQTDSLYKEEPTPQQSVNMGDGWYAESETVELMAKAGLKVYDRQGRVKIGRSSIPGSYDGKIDFKGESYLWEHKAWNDEAFDSFVRNGLDNRPGEWCQVNGYMFGADLKKVDFWVKKKQTNDYHDKVFELDLEFLKQVLEWADEVRLGGWIPKPEECKWCSSCGVGCFPSPKLDFTQIGSFTNAEMVESWKKGYAMSKAGEYLMDTVRSYLVGKKDKYGTQLVEGIIKDEELFYLDGGESGKLEVKKIVAHRFDINKGKVLELFGPEGLMSVGEEKEIPQYRIREV